MWQGLALPLEFDDWPNAQQLLLHELLRLRSHADERVICKVEHFLDSHGALPRKHRSGENDLAHSFRQLCANVQRCNALSVDGHSRLSKLLAGPSAALAANIQQVCEWKLRHGRLPKRQHHTGHVPVEGSEEDALARKVARWRESLRSGAWREIDANRLVRALPEFMPYLSRLLEAQAGIGAFQVQAEQESEAESEDASEHEVLQSAHAPIDLPEWEAVVSQPVQDAMFLAASEFASSCVASGMRVSSAIFLAVSEDPRVQVALRGVPLASQHRVWLRRDVVSGLANVAFEKSFWDDLDEFADMSLQDLGRVAFGSQCGRPGCLPGKACKSETPGVSLDCHVPALRAKAIRRLRRLFPTSLDALAAPHLRQGVDAWTFSQMQLCAADAEGSRVFRDVCCQQRVQICMPLCPNGKAVIWRPQILPCWDTISALSAELCLARWPENSRRAHFLSNTPEHFEASELHGSAVIVIAADFCAVPVSASFRNWTCNA